MNGIKRLSGLILAGIFVLSLVASCAQKPSEQDIKMMEEAKTAAIAAEGQLQDVKKKRTDLENQVRTKMAEKEAAQKELDAVKKRIEAMKTKTDENSN